MGRERRKSQAARTVVAIGLTGSIGAGKSTVLALLGECGASVFSADQVVHRLYEQPELAAAVARYFGARVLGPTGVVDRPRVAEAIKGKPGELRRLEELTHPLVADEIARVVATAAAGTVVVCEVPLLFESGYESLFDLVVTVEAEGGVRRRRSTHAFDLEQFAEFEALQASSERRVEGSDLAYINDGGLEELREFARDVYQTALAMLSPAPEQDRR